MLDKYRIEHPKIKRKTNIPLKFGVGETQPNSIEVKDNYRIAVYFRVFDVIIQEMENQMEIINGLNEILISEDILKIVCSTYKFNIDNLKTELNIFNRMFNQKYSDSR